MDTSDPRVIEKTMDLRFMRNTEDGRLLLQQRCRVARLALSGEDQIGWEWVPVEEVP